ncbi:MAG: DUF4382 domain-containing protein [Proteobacteria bacterium]|nr:DUF4382 domain-containing protein [Pseudomonadota bacterium]
MKLKNIGLIGSILAVLAAGVLIAACGGSDGDSSSAGEGTLVTSLTDSTTQDYSEVWVTIDKVEAHYGDEDDEDGYWVTVAEPEVGEHTLGTYNLLVLVNGVRETLGVTEVEAGYYSQMRLIIGSEPYDDPDTPDPDHPHANYVVDADGGAVHELKVPSGPETGWKIVGGFYVLSGQTQEITLDFDASRSVVKAGDSGLYLLKPTVTIFEGDAAAIVSGTVTDGSEPLEGAFVMAQTADPAAADTMDQVVIKAGTLSGEFGSYRLYMLPGTYNIVAVEDGFSPACETVDLALGDTTTVDFALDAALATSTIGVNVSIAGAGSTDSATIDFRQEIACAGTTLDQMITVETVDVMDGYSSSVILPVSDYQVIGAFGETTITVPVMSSDMPTTIDFSF